MYIILIIAILILGSVAYAAASGAPWVPTWKRDIERMLRIAELSEKDVFYELGCGDGRICSTVAKSSKARVVGVELSVPQFLAAKIRAIGKPSMKIRLANAHSIDLSEVSVVYMFLMPDTYKKIAPKLKSELKPGSRIISYVWPIPGFEPELVDKEEGRSNLYLYKV